MLLKFKQPIVIIAITLFSLLNIQAQKGFDLSSLNYAEMSDVQLQQLFKLAQAKGYSQSDLLNAAKAKGLSSIEIAAISKRFRKLNTPRNKGNNGLTSEDTRLRSIYSDSTNYFIDTKSDIFGLNVFNGKSLLTFQANINMPTPADYILGPGDKLFIDVYGQSEVYYQPEVSPEGTVILENFGPIQVTGLTVTAATKRIKSRLAKVYQGITGNHKNTFLNVSVGNSRSIKVNVVGEVAFPGTYTFSAFNTVYNALYVAGGFTEKATLRAIKVYRNNKLISNVDIYKYLKNGNASADVRLENNDLILVSPYTNRVTLNGETKIEGRFELNKDESLQDLLNYASGFTEKAYTKTIKVTRVVDGEHLVADINKDQFEIFTPKAGDVFEVGRVLDRYKNRIIVKGAVYRPGVYSITNGLGVKELITKTAELKPDALTSSAFIIRTNKDLTTSTISFNLKDVIEGKIQDIPLQKEDVLTVLSKNELKEEFYVEVSGAINLPGIYPYSKGMRLKDLILIAGGFNESATSARVEITRNVSNTNGDNSKLADVIVVDLTKDFNTSNDDNNIMIYPFDHITVRKDPNFHEKQFAFVEGQVYYPGQYAIKSKNEKISDLLKRSGGINKYAYVEGATLIRKKEINKKDTEINKQANILEALKENLIKGKDSLTETEKGLLVRVKEDLNRLAINNPNNKLLMKYLRVTKESLSGNLSTQNKNIRDNTESIGINLKEIIENPGSVSDLLLQAGDILSVPEKLETVRLTGELFHPSTVRYQKNKSLKYYVDNAGGFESRAKKSKTYVVYPNGEIRRTKKILFFNFYPMIKPGSEIIVPKKPKNNPIGVASIAGITSGVATLILAISQIKF